MIMVFAEGKVPGNQREAYLKAVAESGAVLTVRQEKGCLRYDVSASASDSDTVYITESWENFNAVREHMTGDGMAALNDINAKFFVAYVASLYQASPLG